jgi:phenylpropionate dioxygenase-like ring-hydroxylating dioxygenase large terminal subunit
MMMPAVDQPTGQNLSDVMQSLPAWTYRDLEFFEAEKQRIFQHAWQVLCHVSDIPRAGDYHTLRFLGENLMAIRDADGQIRSFYNVCRHRAARLLDDDKGHCPARITCPYHAWSYGFDGRLVGVPQREDFQNLDLAHHGLVEVAQEIFMGFIFVSLGRPDVSVADIMAPYAHEFAAYRPEDLVPQGRVTFRTRHVNWKNVGDNYADGLHINVAHPGLTRLFGHGYGIEAKPMVDKMWGMLKERESTNWSERMYQRHLPHVDQLPQERQRLWTYFKLWPNLAFDIYPDQIDFMQFLPISPTETLVREIAYVHPDARREMKAARYLNWRINRQVSLEDKDLIERVQDGMGSASYSTGPLGASEVCLRRFAARMRALIPQANLDQPPQPGWSRLKEVQAP